MKKSEARSINIGKVLIKLSFGLPNTYAYSSPEEFLDRFVVKIHESEN